MLCGASQNNETDLWLRSQVGFFMGCADTASPKAPLWKGSCQRRIALPGCRSSPVISFRSCFAKGNQLLIALWLQDNPSVTAGAVPPPFPQGRLAAKGLIAQFTERCIEVRPFVLNGFCSAEQSEAAAINRWTVAFVSRIFLSFLLCAREAVPMPAFGWPKDLFDRYPQTRV